MYIALKACKFAGKAYKIGDTIESSVVLPEAAPRLILSGVIAAVDENSIHADSVEGGSLLPPSSTLVTVPILAEEGIAEIELTPEELVQAVTIAQMEDDVLTEKVQVVESEDVLLLIAVLNGGNVAFEATKARVEELGAHIYTEEELTQKVKDELIVIAESYGLEAKASMKKEEIVNLILEKQGE